MGVCALAPPPAQPAGVATRKRMMPQFCGNYTAANGAGDSLPSAIGDSGRTTSWRSRYRLHKHLKHKADDDTRNGASGERVDASADDNNDYADEFGDISDDSDLFHVEHLADADWQTEQDRGLEIYRSYCRPIPAAAFIATRSR